MRFAFCRLAPVRLAPLNIAWSIFARRRSSPEKWTPDRSAEPKFERRPARRSVSMYVRCAVRTCSISCAESVRSGLGAGAPLSTAKGDRGVSEPPMARVYSGSNAQRQGRCAHLNAPPQHDYDSRLQSSPTAGPFSRDQPEIEALIEGEEGERC